MFQDIDVNRGRVSVDPLYCSTSFTVTEYASIETLIYGVAKT